MVMHVILTMKDGTVVKLPHITEIHYNYPNADGSIRVAFESQILGIGCTYSIMDVKEFEAHSERQQYTDNLTDMNILILKKMGIDMSRYLKYALQVIDDVQRITETRDTMDTE